MWLDKRHRAYGLGPLFALDEWQYDGDDEPDSQPLKADILNFANRARSILYANGRPIGRPPDKLTT